MDVMAICWGGNLLGGQYVAGAYVSGKGKGYNNTNITDQNSCHSMKSLGRIIMKLELEPKTRRVIVGHKRPLVRFNSLTKLMELREQSS